ncbi:hypothetical protein Pint_13600 [Pistacia integerrima]|uniref:Uncharacterized protein n=1 Tax=Pistacia integerrima TaxID=434235 RepID=A0ACC0YA36_9ROSI|nr:hypothetical protein Pint_13600 [Pistacia integerrima]
MATLFSKFVNEIDMTRSLSIPTSPMGLKHFEENQLMDMHVQDDCGQLWMFSCSIQKNGDAGCALCVDWLEFVRHKDVRIGDEVIFIEDIVKDEAMGARIKIQVKRKIRLFGQDIWAPVK